MKKDNKILKFFSPILAIVYTVGIILLEALPLNTDDYSLTNTLISISLQFVGAIFTLFIVIKIYPRFFENVPNYKLKMLSPLKIIGIFLIVPFGLMLEYDIIYSVLVFYSNESLSIKNFVTDNIYADLVAGISALFLAPVTEELGFRYMTLSPFKKKSHRIMVLIFVSLIFGFMHTRNFISTFLHSLIVYGLVFLTTKNIVYSIFIHASINFTLLLFEILSTKHIMNIKMIAFPSILIFDSISHIIYGLVSVIGILLLVYDKSKNV